jgi:hypothetical protein
LANPIPASAKNERLLNLLSCIFTNHRGNVRGPGYSITDFVK